MQATQSRTASESVGQSIGFAALHRIHDGTNLKPEVATLGVAERAGLAHDAGNLLGALTLYSELLAMPGVLHEEYREYAEELRLLSDRSWAMIGRLVNYARAERKTAQARVVVPEVVERCRGVLSRVAGRRVEVFYGTGADLAVSVQAESMERILTNLVKNAAEATAGVGTISVTVEGAMDGARRRVVMTIRDTGRGMSSETVRSLMHVGQDSSIGGRGLGFRVVRELVAMSGGCLNIESYPGTGTSISTEWYAMEDADDLAAGQRETMERREWIAMNALADQAAC
jgi:signal transduction histidine kinase